MSKIRDGLYGVCVADALGVPAECRTRADLKIAPITAMTDGGIRKQPAGSWSDDSSMTLCLAKSIGEVGFFHTHDIMDRFVDWFQNDAYTPYGKCFDFGHTTAKAILRYQNGVTPALCGSNKTNENGNGSLMRILPAAFVLYQKYGRDIPSYTRAMEAVHKISGLTHRHPVAMSGCGIYVAIACRIIDGQPLEEAIREGIHSALYWYERHRSFVKVIPVWRRIADTANFAQEPEETIRSGGYVAESLESALWCLLNTDNYADCVLTAVNLGYDADTTAAIAGGLAGLYYGYDSIPPVWLDQLGGKEIIEDCIHGMERYLYSNQ